MLHCIDLYEKELFSYLDVVEVVQPQKDLSHANLHNRAQRYYTILSEVKMVQKDYF